MNKKELWQRFLKTGKVTDYLEYKNANESHDVFEEYDEEYSDELSVVTDSDFKEYEDDNQYGRFSDT